MGSAPERISDAVEFFPRKFRIPKISSIDADIHDEQYLIHALQNPAPASPLVTLGNEHNEKLRYLTNILDKATSPEIPPRVVHMEHHQPII